MYVGLVSLDLLCVWALFVLHPYVLGPSVCRFHLCLDLVAVVCYVCDVVVQVPAVPGPIHKRLTQTETRHNRNRHTEGRQAQKHSSVSMACLWNFFMCVSLVCLGSFCLWAHRAQTQEPTATRTRQKNLHTEGTSTEAFYCVWGLFVEIGNRAFCSKLAPRQGHRPFCTKMAPRLGHRAFCSKVKGG